MYIVKKKIARTTFCFEEVAGEQQGQSEEELPDGAGWLEATSSGKAQTINICTQV